MATILAHFSGLVFSLSPTRGGVILGLNMRPFRPIVTNLSEVTITRQKDEAIIEYKDPTYGTTHFGIGPELEFMTDAEVIELYNESLRAQNEFAARQKYVALEIPLGRPQIEFHPESDQWSPRGHVLRCEIDNGGEEDPGREPRITVDSQMLSWREFGTLLCTFAGWGMRVEFVGENETHRRPPLKVGEPETLDAPPAE